ncbi:MAG: glucose 1-dehydrogenase [Frankiaceae bacterium]|nr:glucose 1-dehydrogenase [Frankiaceae bacterium]
MKALTVRPTQADSAAVVDIDDAKAAAGEVLCATRLVGICGTDIEIIAGEYGAAPDGHELLVLGHESLGVVREAQAGSGFGAGDLVVPMVRWPDPQPCEACAAGEWDMCRNGEFTEHGISGRDGFARELYAVPPHRLVPVPAALGERGVLVEPTSVVAKAWEQMERIAKRAVWTPRTVLITGAGPIGLLAALIGVQHGYDVHVLDRVADGPKPQLVGDLGATYHSTSVDELGFSPDLVIECTGVAAVVVEVLSRSGRDGITCLTGVSSTGKAQQVDIGALNRSIVLENDVVFGSVNANRRHYELAVEALGKGDPAWLDRLISRRVPLADFQAALRRQDDDVKVVLEVAEA